MRPCTPYVRCASRLILNVLCCKKDEAKRERPPHAKQAVCDAGKDEEHVNDTRDAARRFKIRISLDAIAGIGYLI